MPILIEIYCLSNLTTIFPGEPGLAGFIEAKEDGSGSDNWSYKTRNGAR